MLGSSTSQQSDRSFDEKVWKFVTVVRNIMKCSAQMVSIPPSLADKLNLKVYKDFEENSKESLELGK